MITLPSKAALLFTTIKKDRHKNILGHKYQTYQQCHTDYGILTYYTRHNHVHAILYSNIYKPAGYLESAFSDVKLKASFDFGKYAYATVQRVFIEG